MGSEEQAYRETVAAEPLGTREAVPGQRTQPHTTRGLTPEGAFRVLLVDDQPLFRERLAQVLQQEPDFSVCGEADTAEQALRCIEQTPPGLLILEVALKGDDGLGFIKRIRTKEPAVLILVLTRAEESYLAERAIRAGAQGFLTKYEPANRIVQAARALREGQVYLTHCMALRVAARAARSRSGSEVDPVDRLTNRELRVFELLGAGLGTRRIAHQMHLHVATVETYRSRIKEKLQLEDATELRQHAIQWLRRRN